MDEPVKLASGEVTKWQLAELLFHFGTRRVLLPDGARGILGAVQRESGSGSSFNLTVMTEAGVVTRLHLYTRD